MFPELAFNEGVLNSVLQSSFLAAPLVSEYIVGGEKDKSPLPSHLCGSLPCLSRVSSQRKAELTWVGRASHLLARVQWKVMGEPTREV